eukprot:TRINITY_DN54652_c0_g1_i1.p1 TRINITY_DN54652_c0_g1~~TRINITY_DN54652_c0_g1_i1.p1  ORF type:complete len:1121 (-),score=158.27 TRINITY_DN54652_c0_g1_i1:101-3463(-)
MACIDGGPSTCTVFSDNDEKFPEWRSCSNASTTLPWSTSSSPTKLTFACSQTHERQLTCSELSASIVVGDALANGIPSTSFLSAKPPYSPSLESKPQNTDEMKAVLPMPPSSPMTKRGPRPSLSRHSRASSVSPAHPPQPPLKPWVIGLDDGIFSKAKTPRPTHAFIRAPGDSAVDRRMIATPATITMQSALAGELEVAQLLQTRRLRGNARFRPQRWLQAREEALKHGRFSDLALLTSNVRRFTELAIERGEYWIDPETSVSTSRASSDGVTQKGTLKNLRSYMSRAPRVEWFGRRNLGNCDGDVAAPAEESATARVPPLTFDGQASCLDIALSMRRRGMADERTPVVVVVEVTDFDMQGTIDIANSNSMTPGDLLLRTDFATFVSEARRALAADGGQGSMKSHLVSAHSPYIFRCPNVTIFRGPHSLGYPFLEEPMQVHILVTALSNTFPPLTRMEMKRYGTLEWYTNHEDHDCLLERLRLLGTVAYEQVPGSDGHELEKPLLIMTPPGCDANVRQPVEAVGVLLKHWRRRFSKQFTAVIVCCCGRGIGDSDLAACLEPIVNRDAENNHGQCVSRGSQQVASDLRMHANAGLSHDIMELVRARTEREGNEATRIKHMMSFGADAKGMGVHVVGREQATRSEPAKAQLGDIDEKQASDLHWPTHFEASVPTQQSYLRDISSADINVSRAEDRIQQPTLFDEISASGDCRTLKVKGKAFLQVSLKLMREESMKQSGSQPPQESTSQDDADDSEHAPWISSSCLLPRGSCVSGPPRLSPRPSKMRHSSLGFARGHDTKSAEEQVLPNAVSRVPAASAETHKDDDGVTEFVGRCGVGGSLSSSGTGPMSPRMGSRNHSKEKRRRSSEGLIRRVEEHQGWVEDKNDANITRRMSHGLEQCDIQKVDAKLHLTPVCSSVGHSPRSELSHDSSVERREMRGSREVVVTDELLQVRSEQREKLRHHAASPREAASVGADTRGLAVLHGFCQPRLGNSQNEVKEAEHRAGGGHAECLSHVPTSLIAAGEIGSKRCSAAAPTQRGHVSGSQKLRMSILSTAQATTELLAQEIHLRSVHEFREAEDKVQKIRDLHGDLTSLASGLTARIEDHRRTGRRGQVQMMLPPLE